MAKTLLRCMRATQNRNRAIYGSYSYGAHNSPFLSYTQLGALRRVEAQAGVFPGAGEQLCGHLPLQRARAPALPGERAQQAGAVPQWPGGGWSRRAPTGPPRHRGV
eukprot:3917120-Pyramimonas_sp.AAC.1